MTGKKKRPGETRRLKRRRKQRGAAPKFHRPESWARAELVGVENWLKRLKGSEGQEFPEGWRKGQIKHYRKRAKMLREEIKATIVASAASKDEADNGPTAA